MTQRSDRPRPRAPGSATAEPASAGRPAPVGAATGRRLLADRYEIVEKIGEGGTAEVFRGRDLRLERVVAIKLLRPQFSHDPQMRERFAVEARSAAGLTAAHVVPVYDFGTTDDGSLFIVMQLIEGRSLREFLRERGSLSEPEAAWIGGHVAAALAAAHARDLVHRDVKPGNVLIDLEGRAHLTDFGIVKALGGRSEITQTGLAFGTAAYLSPEQATGGPVEPRSDLYALGTVLYEMIAGRPPFSGDDPASVGYRQAWERPAPLSDLAPDVDPELESLVMRCLEKDPRYRPASAREVGDELERIGERLQARSGAGAWSAGDTATVATVLGSAAAAPRPAGPVPPSVRDETVGLPLAPAAPLESAVGSGYRTGVVPGRRGRLAAPVAARRRGMLPFALIGAVVGLVVLALAGSALGAFDLFGGGDETPTDPGLVAEASPTPTPSPTTAAVVPPVLPEPSITVPAMPTPSLLPTAPPTPEPTVTPSPIPTRQPAPQPTPTPTLAPTPEPPPQPSPEPTPRPTREPTPRPTREPTPPPPPPTDPPADRTVTVTIPNQILEGGYDRGGGRYKGRTASWVYGQGTSFDTMSGSFAADGGGSAVGTARLRLVGMDDERPEKNPIRLILNGQVLYRPGACSTCAPARNEALNPLPNDFCCGPTGDGNWGAVIFEFPASLLRDTNELSITNLSSSDCTLCPFFVMVDFGELTYRTRG
ncbi:MAG: protein kinase [Chloroflexota bacterium]|nr:protein kinase [Chloroflexota bacterium]